MRLTAKDEPWQSCEDHKVKDFNGRYAHNLVPRLEAVGHGSLICCIRELMWMVAISISHYLRNPAMMILL